MRKYILGKSIENSGANDVEDLNGMGKAMWEFISAIYDSTGIAFLDNNNMTFRNKVKFNSVLRSLNPRPHPKVKKQLNLPLYLLSHLPFAKSQKEVNKISKYFKKNTMQIPPNCMLKHHPHLRRLILLLPLPCPISPGIH